MKQVERGGPEAILVRPWVDPRAALAEFAVRGTSRAEARAVDEMLRRELALLPVRHSVAHRLLRWGRQRLRRDDVLLAAGPAVWRERAEPRATVGSEARLPEGPVLALLPALRVGRLPPDADP